MSSFFKFESEGNLRKPKNISLVKQKIIKDVIGWFRTEEITMDYNLET